MHLRFHFIYLFPLYSPMKMLLIAHRFQLTNYLVQRYFDEEMYNDL